MTDRGQLENQENQSFQNNNNQPAGSSRAGDEPRSSDNGQERRTASRGFAAMDPEKQKRIASEGGRAAHRMGVAHEWSRDEAREAGRKGGQMVSRNREHMSEIGRKGGQSSGQRRQRNQESNNQ